MMRSSNQPYKEGSGGKGSTGGKRLPMKGSEQERTAGRKLAMKESEGDEEDWRRELPDQGEGHLGGT